MTNTEADGRVGSLDVFKGLGIFFIAVLHLAIVARSGMGGTPPVVQALYLGLMGFFIMSGYFFRPGRGFKGNMGRRFRILFLALIVSAIALPIICCAWCYVWGQPTGLEDLIDCMARTFAVERSFVDFDGKVPWAICGFSMGYYFLWTMMGSFVIFYAIADRIRDNLKLGLIVIAILVCITAAYRELCDFTLPFYMNLWPISAAFMVCGMYLSKYDLVKKVEASSVRDPKWWGLFLGCTACLLAMVYVFSPGITFDLMHFGDYGGYSAFPYMIEGVLAFVMIVYLSFFISKIPLVSTVFKKLGKHTMGILLLHVFIAKMALAPFFTFDAVNCITADLSGTPRIVFAFAVLIASYLVCAYGPALVKKLRGRDQ